MTKNIMFKTTKFNNGQLINGDCLKILPVIKTESIKLIFADPPYFLSNGGISCKSGKIVSVNKGNWDKETDKGKIKEFYTAWIKECKRILQPNGTIWITGTFHNIFLVGLLLNEFDFKILNMVTWVKADPPPNLSKRMFTHSSEFIIWAKKSKNSHQFFNHELMKKLNNENPMSDVWILPSVSQKEKKFGYHPTQKPICLLERIILSSTKEQDLILDPFSGSSTTGVAATLLNRRFLCIEQEKNYYQISLNRLAKYSNLHT